MALKRRGDSTSFTITVASRHVKREAYTVVYAMKGTTPRARCILDDTMSMAERLEELRLLVDGCMETRPREDNRKDWGRREDE